MGVRYLTTYVHKHLNGIAYKKVSIVELRNEFQKDDPNSPIELLLDFECIIRYLYTGLEWRYGGDNVSFLKTLRNFYDKFNAIGIKLVAFFGNYTNKNKRKEWLKRRYEAIACVNELIGLMNSDSMGENDYKDAIYIIPPGLVNASLCIIQNVLKEKVIQSLTENDIEIMTYARRNKSFGILSQDSDFIIANAGIYFLSMKNLDMNDMTTYIYDGKALAHYHQLSMNQLPLYATLIGTDIMGHDLLENYHERYKKNNYCHLPYFFKQIAQDVKTIKCYEYGVPGQRDLDKLIDKLLRGPKRLTYRDIYYPFIDSIKSYVEYKCENELNFNFLKTIEQKNTLKIALCLYRQCWITSDLLIILSSHTTEMSTCMEIFEPSVKAIGNVLSSLRSLLYGVIFHGIPDVNVTEYVIEDDKCWDHRLPHRVRPTQLNNTRPLLDVWNTTLIPNRDDHLNTQVTFTEFLTCHINTVIYERNTDNIDNAKEYFIDILSQYCTWKDDKKLKLVTFFKEKLPSPTMIPLCSFLYLETDSGVYLSSSERDAILFTFATVSILTLTQILSFKHPDLKKINNSVNFMRATNLFKRACRIMISLNAVCGFPVDVYYVDAFNFWEGSIAQLFYEYLSVQKKSTSELYAVIQNVLSTFSCINAVLRFKQLFQTLKELNLFGDSFQTEE